MGIPSSGVLGGDNITQGTFKTEIENLRDSVAGGYCTNTVVNFTTDADLILTDTQNANQFIQLTDTGVVLTVGRNVIVTTDVRVMYVENSTAQTLTIKTSGGTGIAIIAGDKKELICDGVNITLNYDKVITSTDNAVARYDGTGGELQDSGVLIDDSDNVLIDTTSSTALSGSPTKILKLGGDVYDGSGDTRTIQVNNQSITSTQYGFISNVVYNNHFLFAWRGSTAGSITSPNAASVAYNTSSDYRLKEDIKEMIDVKTRIMSLKPVNFKWKEEFGGTRVDGFIAHEVQQVIPEAVTGKKDAMKKVFVKGDKEEILVEDYQGIDQSKLVPILTAGLQEAFKEIEDLKRQLNEMVK